MQAKTLMAALTLVFMTGSLMAKTDPSQIARLGKDLTPVGAEKAGNPDGSIPAWDGGLTKVPAGFDAAKGYADPYVGEKPLSIITAENAARYQDKLSPGQLAMFKKYPATFKMNIYPTHRSAAMPEAQYGNISKYAGSAELVADGSGISGAGESTVPFPFPTRGEEVLWNHALRWSGGSFTRDYSWYVVSPSAKSFRVAVTDKWVAERLGYLDQKRPSISLDFIAYYRLPATLQGTTYLIWDTMDQSKETRHSWIYNAGQRRVRRVPDLCCDFTADGTEGLRLADQYDGWNGTTERYDWKLVGKQEMYIPYDSYKLTDKSLKPGEVLTPGHVNPNLIRYELHRVWVVEGKLKPNARHLYYRRVMYFDEDTFQLAAADLYDAHNQLWRTQEVYAMQHYDAKVPGYSGMSFNDLNSGTYMLDDATFEEKRSEVFGQKFRLVDFQPDALRRMGGN